MKKRILPALLVLVMVLSLLPGTVWAAETTSGSCGNNATWTYNPSTKTLTINGTGEINFYLISSDAFTKSAVEHIEFNGNITSLGSNCFEGFSGLTSIVIPDSVNKIQRQAFKDCTKLSHVVIPASVTNFTDSIMAYKADFYWPVFQNCPALLTAGPIGGGYNIEFEWTDAIPANAFLACSSLKSITFPSDLRSIGEAAFAYTGLTNITIPDTVTSIDTDAFFGCGSLEQLTIPASVIRINKGAFEECHKLNNLSVASENRIYSSQDNVLFNKAKTELIWCPESLISYTVPSSVVKIGDEAFKNCTKLTSVVLPSGLQELSGFENCTALKNITLPNGLKHIMDDGFRKCTSLTNVVIPDSVINMSGSFRECTALTEITLSGGIYNYDHSDFPYDSTNIKTVRISSGTVALSGTFSGCTKLTNVYIPDTITKIGEDTFKDCRNLKTIYYSGTQEQWDKIDIAAGNQEIGLANIVYTGSNTPDTPDTPDVPDTPDIPVTPGTTPLVKYTRSSDFTSAADKQTYYGGKLEIKNINDTAKTYIVALSDGRTVGGKTLSITYTVKIEAGATYTMPCQNMLNLKIYEIAEGTDLTSNPDIGNPLLDKAVTACNDSL